MTIQPNTWEFNCSDIFGNSGGDWIGDIAGFLGQQGNFSADPIFCDAPAGNLSIANNSPCAAIHAPCDSLVGAFDVGCTTTDVSDENDENKVTVAKELLLRPNYPNPFNPSTTISYHLPKNASVTLTIVNSLGQVVAELVNEVQPAGHHSVKWNSTDQFGRPVASGVYFYKFSAGSFASSKKMMFVK